MKYELVRSSNECCLLHRTGPVLAQSGHSAMSAIRSLSGEKRTTFAHFETFR